MTTGLGIDLAWDDSLTLAAWKNDFYIHGNQLRCYWDSLSIHPTSWLVKDCDSPSEALALLLLIKVLHP